jgi:Flp pilus assembly protein TadD
MTPAKIDRFQKLLAQNPTNTLFRFSLAQALDQADQSSAALEHYRVCAADQSDWMVPRIALGKLYLKLGQRDTARRTLQEALQLAIDQSHEEPEAELRMLLASL